MYVKLLITSSKNNIRLPFINSNEFRVFKAFNIFLDYLYFNTNHTPELNEHNEQPFKLLSKFSIISSKLLNHIIY